ncbi:hypothetical protein METBIDRAFT_147876 [Metschnikowia bicuspidata var. bicuspidata NRRL YB-4993]|uniref:Uncharacterized protein n=1 Tax=Metschnikowia bicuspidata var. bicuspidata NRRL YB-4993 TaxID=869754 RepID=A0A1A0HE38_9ASCO|nr:hypothetical protein METBIDRAFT_147876 [Metschnikowia bicuspidata var. bicuspidata NRRL YB-4993]OBA22167.1 hypothetical protein METBIDRAFT_147876 [Metschnikowia bicuspidata var. bicuspidata NRRL YB-4993]
MSFGRRGTMKPRSSFSKASVGWMLSRSMLSRSAGSAAPRSQGPQSDGSSSLYADTRGIVAQNKPRVNLSPKSKNHSYVRYRPATHAKDPGAGCHSAARPHALADEDWACTCARAVRKNALFGGLFA